MSLGHEADSVDAAYEAASLDLIASLQKYASICNQYSPFLPFALGISFGNQLMARSSRFDNYAFLLVRLVSALHLGWDNSLWLDSLTSLLRNVHALSKDS